LPRILPVETSLEPRSRVYLMQDHVQQKGSVIEINFIRWLLVNRIVLRVFVGGQETFLLWNLYVN